jgi:heme exporter protein B
MLSGISPTSIYIGKTIGLYIQLIILEVMLFIVMVVLFDMSVESYPLIIASAILTTLAISSSGTLYGVIASGLGVRETLLPVLFLPVLAPAIIGATRAFGDAFGRVSSDGWAWLGLLSVIAIVYTLVGMLTYGNILEDT